MPLFSSFCHKTTQSFEAVTIRIGLTVAWLTAIMALMTCAVVMVRIVFSSGSIAAQESVTYMHALVIMLASAYTLATDGHVRVDIFYRHFSELHRAWVNALGTLLFLIPFASFTLFICWNYVAASWRVGETSLDAGGIPAVYLLKSLLLINGFLLLLQALADLMRNLNIITHNQQTGSRTHD